MGRAGLITVVMLCAAVAPVLAQQDSARAARSKTWPAAVGGIAGSAIGLGAGAGMALLVTDDVIRQDGSWQSGRYVLSLGVGSTLGAAVGAHTGASWGGSTPSFGRVLLGSVAGLIAGCGAAYAIAGVQDNDEPVLISYTVTQGTITGLIAAWRQGEKR
ncbi:MAG TPA: hypothetical protein VMN60_08135 [Longimicrobiales bacterium]|nr:hypothetical protein [Longimicrobiales bacterium]